MREIGEYSKRPSHIDQSRPGFGYPVDLDLGAGRNTLIEIFLDA